MENENPKPYLVYMNLSKDVWVSDAYVWMENNNFTETDFQEIISEFIFNMFVEGDVVGSTPLYFVNAPEPNNKFRNPNICNNCNTQTGEMMKHFKQQK